MDDQQRERKPHAEVYKTVYFAFMASLGLKLNKLKLNKSNSQQRITTRYLKLTNLAPTISSHIWRDPKNPLPKYTLVVVII